MTPCVLAALQHEKLTFSLSALKPVFDSPDMYTATQSKKQNSTVNNVQEALDQLEAAFDSSLFHGLVDELGLYRSMRLWKNRRFRRHLTGKALRQVTCQTRNEQIRRVSSHQQTDEDDQ